MTEIIELQVKVRQRANIRDLRADYGLSIVQAAKALGTSPSAIENWEAGSENGPSEEFARTRLQSYLLEYGRSGGNNLLFGIYPLRVARDILGLTVAQIAAEYDYSLAAWQKIEANTRFLDREKFLLIEERVRQHFVNNCNSY